MKVLFICKYNAGRSRMAEAFFNKFSKKNTSLSRGIEPYPISPSAERGLKGTIEVMNEVGIKVPNKLGSPVTKEDVEEADVVVVLLDEKQQLLLPDYVKNSPKTRYNGIVDSDSRSPDYLNQNRLNRDKIQKMVLALLKEIE